MTLSPSEPPGTFPATTSPPRGLGLLFLVAGLIGLLSAAALLVEKIRVLSDPEYVPSCSINPVLSCGSVMNTPQAEVFGFPNPLMGVAGFAVVATVGAALLARAAFARWFWIGLQVGMIAGIVLVHWLVFQSLYRIGALCPYCMVVWTVTIPVFLFGTLHVLGSGVASAPGALRAAALRVAGYAPVILTVWYLVIATMIAVRFWYYWRTLLS